MNIVFKIIVVAEVLVCFSLPALMLVGAVFSVKFWEALFNPNVRNLIGVALVLSAALGIGGVVSLLIKIIFPKKTVAPPLVLWIYLILGIAAMVVLAIRMGPRFDIYNWAHVLLFVAPLLVTVQLIYLGRNYLFRLTASARLSSTL